MNKGFITNTVLAVMTATGLALTAYGLFEAYNNRAETAVTSVPMAVSSTAATSPTITTVMTNLGAKKIKQLNLNDKQVITIYGEIGEEAYFTAKHITELAKNGRPIYILLNSPGGSVFDGALIVSAIEGSTVPVYTVVEGLCASMCQVIHAYGTKRMMVDRAILMGHPASGGAQGTLEQMQSRLNMIQRYVNKFNAYIAKRAGLELNEYLAMVVSEMWLDAEDATNAKFNDEIVNIQLKVVPVNPINIFEEKRKGNIKERINVRW